MGRFLILRESYAMQGVGCKRSFNKP